MIGEVGKPSQYLPQQQVQPFFLNAQMAGWTKYWVSLCGSQLVYYPAKTLRATLRNHVSRRFRTFRIRPFPLTARRRTHCCSCSLTAVADTWCSCTTLSSREGVGVKLLFSPRRIAAKILHIHPSSCPYADVNLARYDAVDNFHKLILKKFRKLSE